MSHGEILEAESKAYRFDPKNIAPREVQQRLWALLKWRDGIYRSVSNSLPGLSSLVDNLTEALNTCKSLSHLAFAGELTRPIDVYKILAPWLTVSVTPDCNSVDPF